MFGDPVLEIVQFVVHFYQSSRLHISRLECLSCCIGIVLEEWNSNGKCPGASSRGKKPMTAGKGGLPCPYQQGC